jgi:hydroxypyruvate isomerase
MALTATRREQHWRFAVGDLVYIAGQEQESAKVTAAIGAGRCDWPHYLVVDHQGAEWLVAQVQLSKLPIIP